MNCDYKSLELLELFLANYKLPEVYLSLPPYLSIILISYAQQ